MVMVSVASIVVVSVESTSVVTLLHMESHDFRPLPSPQLSPSARVYNEEEESIELAIG